MFDIGWTELMVIGVVALIVIGPKDLPEMFRQLGRFTGKLKSMSREFSRAMEQAANDSGVSDVARDLNTLTDPRGTAINSVKGAVDKFGRIRHLGHVGGQKAHVRAGFAQGGGGFVARANGGD